MSDPVDPTDATRAQYERWSYPDPSIGPERRAAWNCPTQFSALYWPAGPPSGELRILVAGCGTTEAVQLAARNPGASVVGVDVSQRSLALSRGAADDRGILNLSLHQLPVERVGELGQVFDFISVGGVLHHLADPVLGLAALAQVLSDVGVISVAVYARCSRVGLKLIQELFDRLGLGQTADDVALVRQTLAALPPEHPVRTWMAATGEVGALDSHLVDTWLNARECSYDVAGVLDLVEAAGLELQAWHHNVLVYPDATFGPEHPLHSRLLALGVPAVWSAMERVRPFNDHSVVLTHPSRPTHSWNLDFGSDELPHWVPVRRHPAHVSRPGLPYDHRDELQTELYRQIDGRTTVRAMLARAALRGDPAELLDFARRFLVHLWRKDAIFVRLPPPGGWPRREILGGD